MVEVRMFGRPIYLADSGWYHFGFVTQNITSYRIICLLLYTVVLFLFAGSPDKLGMVCGQPSATAINATCISDFDCRVQCVPPKRCDSNQTANCTCVNEELLQSNKSNICNWTWTDILSGNTSLCHSYESSTSTINKTCDRLSDVRSSLEHMNEILGRFDCRDTNKYSMEGTCDKCRKCYKDWLCVAELFNLQCDLGVKKERSKVACCTDIDKACNKVLEMCPVFAANDSASHGGHPVFGCPQPGKCDEKDTCVTRKPTHTSKSTTQPTTAPSNSTSS